MQSENLLEVVMSQKFSKDCAKCVNMIQHVSPNQLITVADILGSRFQWYVSFKPADSIWKSLERQEDRCMVLQSANALPGVDGRWRSSKHSGVKTIQGGSWAQDGTSWGTPTQL